MCLTGSDDESLPVRLSYSIKDCTKKTRVATAAAAAAGTADAGAGAGAGAAAAGAPDDADHDDGVVCRTLALSSELSKLGQRLATHWPIVA